MMQQLFLIFLLVISTSNSYCSGVKTFAVELGCIALDFTPIPFAGSACSLGNAIYNKDFIDIASNVFFLGFDWITLGQGHWIKASTANVSKLARMVKKAGKIIKNVKVGNKKFKYFRLGAA
jgi:hypothetical protein